MIRVLFFASVRQRVGVDAVEITPAEAGPDLASLRRALAARGPAWEAALGEEARLLAAINQQTTDMASVVDDGDEVAFFPPVTGG